MKYAFLLLSVAFAYFLIARNAPIAPVVQTITSSEAAPLTGGPRDPGPTATPAGTALKQPIDRTRAVLEQAKQRNGQGEF